MAILRKEKVNKNEDVTGMRNSIMPEEERSICIV